LEVAEISVMSRGWLLKALAHENTIAVESLGFLEFGWHSRNLGGDGRCRKTR
jgi:hypothetical protein